jgi:hypothetical protein
VALPADESRRVRVGGRTRVARGPPPRRLLRALSPAGLDAVVPERDLASPTTSCAS